MSHEYPYSIKRHGTTLEKCEDEPVQTPGCIQAHGVLLVLRRGDLTVLQISENSREWLGLPPRDLLGKSVHVAVGESVSQTIRNALDHEKLEKAPLYLTTLQSSEPERSRALHVTLHTYTDLAFLELEDAAASDAESPDQNRVEPDYYGLVRKTLTRFQEASSLKALSRTITEEVRRITGLDRVMVYFFHADDSGEIIAESKREEHGSWLGWRYPAHDIPRPAREIFKKIWSRSVPDVRAELFEMVPLLNPDTRKALDMTYCSLRGASVMYTEYLDNMGVRAALTLPLLRAGELWGLVACHHDTPRLMSHQVRAASEFLARGASQQLQLVEERENAEYRISLEEANYALISKVAHNLELSAFTEGPVHLGGGLDCGGAAIFYEGTWNTVGQTPKIQEITELGQWLLTQPACQEGALNPIFTTDHLSEIYPAAKAFARTASGLMAFCFSRNLPGLVLYFKPETLQTLTWAGNPNELPVLAGPHGPRLSPRKSFEVWRETVSNRAMPWKKVETEAVLKLRGLLIDMLVSRAEQIKALQLRVAERTRELVTSQGRLQAVLNAATETAIISCDREYIITVFNSGAERMLGYTAEEMVGKQTPVIFHLESEIIQRGRELTEELGRPVQGMEVFEVKFLEGRPEEREWTYVRKDGSQLLVQLTVSATRDAKGDVIASVGVAIDITARKHYESQLLEAKERSELADRAKSDFLATISHEIRTPMNGVIGVTGLLLDTRLDAEQRKLAETIRTSGQSLMGLLNDILDFSKVEAGQLTFEEIDFDLRKVVEDSLELTAGQAQAKGVELACEVDPEMFTKVRGDPGRLQQILTNLINNAIKFTTIGEVTVSVTVETELETEIAVRFEIKDTGIGIAPETQARLFQPFVQADSSTTRKFGGTGLGLAICKRLTDAMKGSIGVESTPGEGSTFRVLLTFPRQIGAPLEPPVVSEFIATRVLVVDDHEKRRTFLHRQMLAWRLRNGCACRAEEALAMLRQAVAEKAPYAVAIIDLQLPAMDGLALAREIKADPQLKATRLMLLTPFAKPVSSEELKAADIAACCTKPVRQSALFDCLVQALTRQPHTGASQKLAPFMKSAAPLPLRNERILLAEDNLVNQQVALGNLRKLGYHADVVTNGFEVLHALENRRYDIILMDCQMPDLDGYEATRAIRQREREDHHTWIIAMTANVMVGDREKCLAAGMDDYISKPLEPSELLMALTRSTGKPLKPLSADFLSKLKAEHEEQLPQLIELFAESAPTTISEMHRALENSSAADLAMAAHTLKGSCSNFGASPLRDLCAQIEQLGLTGNLNGAAHLVFSAEKELYRLIETLKPFGNPGQPL